MGWHNVLWRDLPECCKGCTHRESDSKDEYSPIYHYCVKNLFLPTKSGKCKKRDSGINELERTE